ncbi:hypothetical protein C8R44DRAFT_804152 [Mycena epipterygia]|nr:hypothetical protein C8R44DRAFT_804152 [Mycena epipterygia]
MPKNNSPGTRKRTSKKSDREIDESQWRVSTVPAERKITKTEVESQYRLKPSTFKGLKTYPTYVSMYYGGEMQDKKVQKYSEREVERLAWKQHGGPEAFESYLNKLRERYNRMHPGGNFSQPQAYSNLAPGAGSVGTAASNLAVAGPSVGIMQLSPPVSNGPIDLTAYTPGLLKIKNRFLKSNLEWLWNAGNSALAPSDELDTGYYAKKKETILKALLIETYPPRPSSLAPESPSYRALLEVLARAPSMHDEVTRKGIDMDTSGFDGHETFTWNTRYLEDLFRALIAVMKDHGLEADGWKSARWEVYDKYAECFSGLRYNHDFGKWSDGAKDWLRGRMELNPAVTYATRQDVNSELGKEYNSMLPELAPGQ